MSGISSSGSELLTAAFKAIGPPGPGYRREISLVARAIRESRDHDALELFGASAVPDPDPVFDRDALERVVEVAECAGKDAHVALDVYTAVTNPSWGPFGYPYFEDAA